MTTRNVRGWAAGLLAAAALLAAPGRSSAAVSILIEEIDAAGNAVPGTTQTFNTAAIAGYATPSFAQINVVASSNSSLPGPTASISTGFSYLNTAPIEPSNLDGIGLRIVVTDTFHRPAGGAVDISSTAGASTGTTGLVGTNTVQTQTAVLAEGGGTLAVTEPATAVSPSGSNSGAQTAGLSSLPEHFQVQQTIIIRVTGDGETAIPAGQTYGGTAASGAAPVPAPPGLLLGLIALPALGLRRALRRKPGDA